MIVEANMHWRYVDTESNLIMPWYTLPVLEWLKTLVLPDLRVFEYGAGYSTIWWRVNVREIISVETHKVWAEGMGSLFKLTKTDFVNSISEHVGAFDIIIVDGEWREECVDAAVTRLRPGGYLIIDNYDSENYNPKANRAVLRDWAKIIHNQPNHTTWKTAVFVKP